jgi:DNA-binding transcriptional LysR family regulator
MNNSDSRPALIRFELAELETFLAVVREGSFSLAARQLHVSQPSVTNRVKRLEETLRVKLLVRTTRRVEPTEDGVLLRDAAEQAMSGLREVVKRFQVNSEQERNRVVVAATPMVAATVMPQVISSYRARYPDVQVLLRDLPYEKVIKSIVEGEAEIGVAALDGAQNTLRFQLLAEEPMLLVVPTRHPLTEAAEVTLDIATGYPMMFLERYTALRTRLAQEYAQRGIAFEPGTASTLPTLLGMIDAGNCITFLPRSMAQSNAKRTRTTLEVVDFKASRRYGSVVARNASLGTAAQSFHLHLRKVFETTLNANA